MIDAEGFRPNVGIIICNPRGQVLWAKRIGQDAWQFPQGGIRKGERLQQAMYRELKEEVGLEARDVEILSSTRDWLYYQLPRHYIRQNSNPVCIGQKQKWFLLSLRGEESRICLSNQDDAPEFDDWQWVSFWYPLSQVIDFKREVYRQALRQLVKPLNRYVNS
ncbi:RNA pyrophosphohydrolase [Pseudohongiella sp. SYSU M77423]|uniref:RNA pyrophosphohydrolase n=1 Tax=unclassified Pseudohongiella TaxID=2629611 RepID=UPI000C49751A|nr:MULTISPECIES: RNA pyrophosphohydrolase [unclassified Pseudohongiella]MAO38743.1 RNA pyrophosphohydrolase [Pseudohongiella sp.]MAY54990.1 RNA pyrophosphohydrolase [Gammaproteobacteria bacterium]MEC8859328.1 RNA pyrophosphohydrolase [Pseudomonadota bacterium]MBJ56266.1 RNA pyrophosphohydrolase [Gammaproteobacteria bacterium]MDH7944124.1 RNA pyrophosphohydrolase [Pseudohongiella sp. SYSU M77423]|tara:strand:+ start:398 stop:886 length:489 start_codon:yes stop_codon:yes gene_type:complete